MANKVLFRSFAGGAAAARVRNEAGGPAYRMPARHALAQYAATGCLDATFYAGAAEQLDTVLRLAGRVEPAFVAKTAVYGRSRAHLKDVPALLLAVLATRDQALLASVFPRVVDSARMLRTFVQIVRSGVAGRRSLGTAPRRLVRDWLASRSDDAIFRAAIGSDPSLADVVRMVHPKPATAARAALYGHLVGRAVAEADLPELPRQLEQFKRGERLAVPDVPMEMLTALPLSRSDWQAVALQASWQTTRMNLNTFARHGVFDGSDGEAVAGIVAARLRDPVAIGVSRVLPYQLLIASMMTGEGVPPIVRGALQDALEVATSNVPRLPGPVVVCPDVSGSMQSPLTGHRKGATSMVRCVDVAALVTAALARVNRGTLVLPFSDDVVPVSVDVQGRVGAVASRLASLPPGGTNCSAPIRYLNDVGRHASIVIVISDNQSWVDAARGRGRATALASEWRTFLRRNPEAKLVCIDLQPYGHVQARDDASILNVGGFSDQVFDLVGAFASGRLGTGHWVEEIEKIVI